MVARGRLALVQQFNRARPGSRKFQTGRGFAFHTYGAADLSKSARLDAGVSLSLGAHLSIYGRFSGLFGPHGRTLGGTAGFRWDF